MGIFFLQDSVLAYDSFYLKPFRKHQLLKMLIELLILIIN